MVMGLKMKWSKFSQHLRNAFDAGAFLYTRTFLACGNSVKMLAGLGFFLNIKSSELFADEGSESGTESVFNCDELFLVEKSHNNKHYCCEFENCLK